jgi:hypothetical protein
MTWCMCAQQHRGEVGAGSKHWGVCLRIPCGGAPPDPWTSVGCRPKAAAPGPPRGPRWSTPAGRGGNRAPRPQRPQQRHWGHGVRAPCCLRGHQRWGSAARGGRGGGGEHVWRQGWVGLGKPHEGTGMGGGGKGTHKMATDFLRVVDKPTNSSTVTQPHLPRATTHAHHPRPHLHSHTLYTQLSHLCGSACSGRRVPQLKLVLIGG